MKNDMPQSILYTLPVDPRDRVAASPLRLPRIARLMALALRFEELLRKGEVKDHAQVAHLGHVTRARITHIMNLLNLAPDIQEKLLFLESMRNSRDTLTER